YLSAPTTKSSKTSAKRTTLLPSFSLSPSQPRSAIMVVGNRHETGRFGQFFMEFHGARSDNSGHQIGRVRYGFLAIFHALATGWVGFQKFQA
ncbi:unnamed protein product, partial [Prunus brigantina]